MSMFGRVGVRLSLLAAVFAVGMGFLYVEVNGQLDEQKADSTLVNLSGRQRMLNQRHMKEVLQVLKGADANYQGTRNLYLGTVNGLLDGGEVVTNPGAGATAIIPGATEAALRDTLTSSRDLFLQIVDITDAAIAAGDASLLNDIDPLVDDTHVAANTAVGLFQAQSESKLDAVRSALSLIGGFVVLVSIVALFLITRSITGPLKRIVDRARSISRGRVDDEPLALGSTGEIGQLGEAFDEMQLSLRQRAEQIDTLASGDLSQGVETLSEHDLVGSALTRLVDGLNDTAEVIGAVSTGRTDVTYAARSSSDRLGQAAESLIASNQDLADVFGRIAAGDTAVRFEPRSEGDVIAHACNRMNEANRHMVEVLESISRGETDVEVFRRSASDALADAAERLLSANVERESMSGDLRRMVDEVARSADEVAASSEELSASSHEVQTSADDTLKHAAEVLASGSQVESATAAVVKSLEDMNLSIGEISTASEAAASRAGDAASVGRESLEIIGRLDEASSNIGEILEVIRSIAAQTDLLALNAAIEAARAGEAGQGFAVVAAEVKALAEQTSGSIDDIANRIRHVQAECQQAVDANGRIVEVVSSLDEIANDIASSVQRQSSATGEVSRLVDDVAMATSDISTSAAAMNGIAESTRQATVEASMAAESLADMATNLTHIVSTH